MSLINTLFGFEAVPRSVHILKKMVNAFSPLAKFHFFCPSCTSLLCTSEEGSNRKRRLWCSTCEAWCSATLGKGTNYFITMSVEEQLKRILKRYGMYVTFAVRSGANVLSDIRDGRLLRSLMVKIGTPRIFSLLFSTDGSTIFKSSGMSMRPISAFVNEIVPKVRFRLPILAGIWCGAGHVSMTLFFKAFVSEMEKTRESGRKLDEQWHT